MHRKTAVVWMSLAVAMLVLPMLTTAQAQDLPEGVSVKVLGEFPSDRPGIETLRLIEFRMEPGAKWESHVVAHTAL